MRKIQSAPANLCLLHHNKKPIISEPTNERKSLSITMLLMKSNEGNDSNKVTKSINDSNKGDKNIIFTNINEKKAQVYKLKFTKKLTYDTIFDLAISYSDYLGFNSKLGISFIEFIMNTIHEKITIETLKELIWNMIFRLVVFYTVHSNLFQPDLTKIYNKIQCAEQNCVDFITHLISY